MRHGPDKVDERSNGRGHDLRTVRPEKNWLANMISRKKKPYRLESSDVTLQ